MSVSRFLLSKQKFLLVTLIKKSITQKLWSMTNSSQKNTILSFADIPEHGILLRVYIFKCEYVIKIVSYFEDHGASDNLCERNIPNFELIK